MSVLWAKTFESAVTFFIKQKSIGPCLRISKEKLQTIIVKGASKLPKVKFWDKNLAENRINIGFYYFEKSTKCFIVQWHCISICKVNAFVQW